MAGGAGLRGRGRGSFLDGWVMREPEPCPPPPAPSRGGRGGCLPERLAPRAGDPAGADLAGGAASAAPRPPGKAPAAAAAVAADVAAAAQAAAAGDKKKPTKKAGAKAALGKNGKPKKKKKAKDPNKPKRAMVAFMYFSIDQRPEVQKRQPELKIADVSKVLGERWRNMSAAQKAKYDAKAAADKKRYEKEMKAYKPPYKPKRPMVAFMFFSIEQRPSVQKKNPSLGIADISKVLGQQWRGMTAGQKAKYEEKAAKDKVRYEKEKQLGITTRAPQGTQAGPGGDAVGPGRSRGPEVSGPPSEAPPPPAADVAAAAGAAAEAAAAAAAARRSLSRILAREAARVARRARAPPSPWTHRL